jgi:aspartyl-tRNA(Asn)/glutamyl-tRNA(Gln) amidotransferase subunit B
MEKGEMRVEANISISEDPKVFGTKVEVKNLNSFKAVEKAIAYEIERHRLLLENGEKISQETRGWDENTGKTFSQRKKEDSHDYRYFPDPDLPKLKLRDIEEFLPEKIKATLPELPGDKRGRYGKEFAIKQDDIELLVLNPHLASFFEEAVTKKTDAQLIANYLLSDVVAIQKTKGDMSFGLLLPEHIRDIAEMIGENILSSRGAKDLISCLYLEGGVAKAVAESKGLIQKNDPEALKVVLAEIITLNQKVVEEYKAGKTASLQFLVGQGMKATKGSANPKMLQDILITLLS